MKEFWLWIIVVSLILALLFVTVLGLVHNHKLLKKTEVILLRAEKLEKEKKSDKRKEDPDEE